MNFSELNLGAPLLSAISERGYTEPTAIQKQAIPLALARKDLIATSQTGTGKTAAFVLPALQRLTTLEKSPHPKILVLTPTRELATQVSDAVRDYGKNLNIKAVSILGGMPYQTQLRQLSKPHDIIIATPGRLIDHVEQGKINLSKIEILILDEADRMLDMGFFEDVEFIASKLPKTRQTLLFTATMDQQLTRFANKLLTHPERIEIAGKTVTLDNIKQKIIMANSSEHKMALLQDLLTDQSIQKAIIFAGTKRSADELTDELLEIGHEVGALHGDMNQRKRNRTITQLRSGKIRLLVATDVASRGIDINNVTHVINYDLPRTGEDYVHRIGRTGRIGNDGIAISLVKRSDMLLVKKIEKYTKQTIEKKGNASFDSSESKPKYAAHKGSRSSHSFSREDDRKTRRPAFSKYGDEQKSRRPAFSKYGDDQKAKRPAFSKYSDEQKAKRPAFSKYSDEQKAKRPAFSKYSGEQKAKRPAFSKYGDDQTTRRPAFSKYGDDQTTRRPAFSKYGDTRKEERSSFGNRENGQREKRSSFSRQNGSEGTSRRESFGNKYSRPDTRISHKKRKEK
ncbi:MAG: DEAD/DEAH box helicase [Gammaproteobacteria bacterium]|nr:DEAD/DEAH box helicase [Gammaproteobacteria bacterium]